MIKKRTCSSPTGEEVGLFPVGSRPCSPMVEAEDLKSLQCGFDPHRGYFTEKEILVSQREDLEKLYKQYAADPRFNKLRLEDIHLIPGKGPLNPKIMLVGKLPGLLENANRLPFMGRAGTNLTHILSDVGLDPYNIFMTNVIKYWPRPVEPYSNAKRYVTSDEFEASREYLREEIRIVNPKVVGLCGKDAVQAIFPERTLWDNGKLIDKIFVPLYHPAVLTFKREKKDDIMRGYTALREYANG